MVLYQVIISHLYKFKISLEAVLVSSGCYNKIPQTKTIDIFSHSPGGWKSRSRNLKIWTWFMIRRVLFLACKRSLLAISGKRERERKCSDHEFQHGNFTLMTSSKPDYLPKSHL